MIDKNRLLNEVVKRERRRKIRNFLMLGAFALVFGAIFSFSVVKNYDRPKFTKELNVVVQTIETTNEGAVINVRLPSDRIVPLPPITGQKDISENQTILILQEELESGKMRYSLVDNAKPKDNE